MALNLEIITQATGASRHLRFEQRAEVSIGRAPGSDLLIDDRTVSRAHATLLVRSPAEVWVRDEGSANGTYVNGRQIEPGILHRFRVGDRLYVGNRTIHSRPLEAEPAAADRGRFPRWQATFSCHHPQRAPEVYVFRADQIELARSPNQPLEVMASHHPAAQLRLIPHATGRCRVVTLGDTPPVFLEGESVTEGEARAGDAFRFAGALFVLNEVVEIKEALRRSAAAEALV